MHLKAHTILTHYVATLMFTRSLFYALLMVPPQSSTWITFTMQHFNTIRNSALSGMNIITRKKLTRETSLFTTHCCSVQTMWVCVNSLSSGVAVSVFRRVQFSG